MLAAVEVLGYFIAIIYSGIWVPEFFTANDQKLERWTFFSTASLSGLLTVYICFLTFGDFKNVFYICHALGMISLCWLIYKIHKGVATPVKTPMESWHWGFFLLCAPILFAIVFTGIDAWDARSVWFFQAKILHQTGTFATNDWHNPLYGFAHMGYPKLFPVVTAFLTSPWEGWNEYAPKLSLLAFLFPLITTLLSLKLKPSTTFLLALAFIGMPGAYIWNGYLDAYLAAFFALGCLSFALYQKTSEKIHFLQSLLLMGVVINLKQEGLALVISFTIATLFLNKNTRSALRDRNLTKFILIPIIAFLFWQFRKIEFGFTDYFSADQSMLSRMASRTFNFLPLMSLIKTMIISHIDIFIFLILLVSYFRIPQLKKLRPQTGITLFAQDYVWLIGAAVIYLCILFIVYLGTPFDLPWYLQTSFKRVILSVKFVIIAYIALCMELPPPSETEEAPDSKAGIDDLLDVKSE